MCTTIFVRVRIPLSVAFVCPRSSRSLILHSGQIRLAARRIRRRIYPDNFFFFLSCAQKKFFALFFSSVQIGWRPYSGLRRKKAISGWLGLPQAKYGNSHDLINCLDASWENIYEIWAEQSGVCWPQRTSQLFFSFGSALPHYIGPVAIDPTELASRMCRYA